MRSPLRRKLLRIGATLLAFAVVVFGILCFQLRHPRKPDFLSLPSPNGYELLLAAANQLQVEDPWKITNEFAAFVHQHEKAFADFEAALRHPAEAPERTYDAESMSVTDLIQLKRLGVALVIKAKQPESEGNWGSILRSRDSRVRGRKGFYHCYSRQRLCRNGCIAVSPPKTIWIARENAPTTDYEHLLRAFHEQIEAFAVDSERSLLIIT